MFGHDEHQQVSPPFHDRVVSIREVLQTLMRFWRLGALVLFVSMLAVVAFLIVSTPLYRATASVLVETTSKNIVTGDEKDGSSSQDFAKVQKALAESRPVFLRALALSGLSSDKLAAITAGGSELPGNFSTRTDIQLIYFDVLDPDSKQAAILANSWAKAFVDEMSKRSKGPSNYTTGFLETSLPEYRSDWVKKQEALNKFELDTRFDPTEFDHHPLRKRVEDLTVKLNNLKIELAGLEAEHEIVSQPAVGVEELIRLARARTDPVLIGVLKQLEDRKSKQMDAQEKFKSDSQDVRSIQENVKSIKAELKYAADSILAGIKYDLLRTHSECKKVQLLYDAADKELELLKTNASRQRVLSSEVAMAERLYTELMQKKSSSELSGRFDFSYARLWEQAEVPAKPYKPRWLIYLLIGFMISVLLSVLSIFLAASLDDKIRNSADVERELNVPLAISLPHVKKYRSVSDAFTRINTKEGYAAANALHNVVLGIALNRPSNQSLLVTVTSTSVKDGNSCVSAMLAGAFSLQGSRVLLVDATPSQIGSLTAGLKIEDKPGLYELLTGTPWSSEFVQRISVQELKVLPSGQFPVSEYASVKPENIRTVLERLKSDYDVIVVDAPPISMFAEAAVFGQSSDVTLLVSRSRRTTPAQLERAAVLLKSAKVDSIQFVVNDVRNRDVERGTFRDYGHATLRPGNRASIQKNQVREEGQPHRRIIGSAVPSEGT